MRKFLIACLFLLLACNFLTPLGPAAPDFEVIAHPDGPLYVGDLVSFEALIPAEIAPEARSVRVKAGSRDLDETEIHLYGLGGRRQATFYWAWDTQDLEPGKHTLTFTLLPDGERWTETFTLLPADQVPFPEPNARWKAAYSECCVLHYISGTQAEADLEALITLAEAEAASVEDRFGAEIQGQVPLTFLPRVLGHGGFASDGIYVSYLRQNYAGEATGQVTHHELVHWLDGQLGGDLKTDLLQEGLAVYLSDGHFKKEPILPRAAALVELGWYLPLAQLADRFYLAQHEIGYLEAAALVSYLVKEYGWEGFNTFYRDLHALPGGSQSQALEAGLQKHFKISLAGLEQAFLVFLRQQAVDENVRTDLRLTVSFYDTVRRYQRDLDPSAYFLHAWLPNVPKMRVRGIVADLLRRPNTAFNQQIEQRLVSADALLRAGNYPAAEAELRRVNVMLDLYQTWVK